MVRGIRQTRVWLALTCAALIAVGCGETAAPPPGDANTAGPSRAIPVHPPLLVLAAASTTEALTAVSRVYESETGVPVTINAAASNALATQILNGVQADIFLSASREWADAIDKQGLATKVRPLLTNDLVLVVPHDNPAGVHEPADLLSEQVARVALAGERVPAGKYAEQALQKLGLYDTLVERNRIARGQDVRVTLSYVERGEAEAGIVYATDARISDRVEVVHTFVSEAENRVVYPVILLKSAQGKTAPAFFEYLFSARAGEIFREHGFTLVPMPNEP